MLVPPCQENEKNSEQARKGASSSVIQILREILQAMIDKVENPFPK